MNIVRLQKIRTYYSNYLKRFYADRPGLAHLSYDEQFRALMDNCFGAADFWTKPLAELGYETFETISNVEALQQRWAAEKEVEKNSDADNWLLEITARQVKWFSPTVLFVADYVTFNHAFLRQLRADNPSIRCIVGWCGAPYPDAAVFHEYDIVLSCVPELVADFRAQGHRAFHVNHAFAPQILEKIDTERTPTTDFAFLGSIVKAHGFHNERERLLTALVEATDLQIWAEVQSPAASARRTKLREIVYDMMCAARRCGIPDSSLAKLPIVGRAARWNERPGSSLPDNLPDTRIAARACPALWGRAMYQQLHDSKVSLNTHIDISPVSASNMRLFEATGVGSCLLTDWRENIATLFEPDAEVVTYRNPEECVERVNYLLQHEQERQAIARAGQRRTLREHTYTQWAAKFDEAVRQTLS